MTASSTKLAPHCARATLIPSMIASNRTDNVQAETNRHHKPVATTTSNRPKIDCAVPPTAESDSAMPSSARTRCRAVRGKRNPFRTLSNPMKAREIASGPCGHNAVKCFQFCRDPRRRVVFKRGSLLVNETVQTSHGIFTYFPLPFAWICPRVYQVRHPSKFVRPRTVRIVRVKRRSAAPLANRGIPGACHRRQIAVIVLGL